MTAAPAGADDAAAMRRIDALYTDHAFYRWRRIAFELKMSRKRVQRLIGHCGPGAEAAPYPRAYANSEERAKELPARLARYNCLRPHGSLGSMPPISRIDLTGNNVLRRTPRRTPRRAQKKSLIWNGYG